MPRVHTQTKSDRGKTYNCTSCGQPITSGQVYYKWSRRFGRSGVDYHQHQACGRPRPTQLTSRKTARIEEALMDLGLDGVTYSVPADLPVEAGQVVELDDVLQELTDLLQPVAEVAREVGEEYQEAYDAMPEGLNQSAAAEAMQQVAQELEEWADTLEGGPDGDTSVDLPDPEQYRVVVTGPGTADVDVEAWRQDAEDAVQQAVQELVDAAQALTEDMPEYQGRAVGDSHTVDVATGQDPVAAVARAAASYASRPGVLWALTCAHDDGCPAMPDGPLTACTCEILELTATRIL